MFTILIIIIVIIAFCCGGSKDKKSQKQLQENEDALAKLPDIYYKSKDLSTLDRFFRGCSNKDILDIFQYTSTNRSIYLKMKDGRSISCPLAELDVLFDKVKTGPVTSIYRIVCKKGSTKFSFYGFDTFTDEQWEVIYSTLTLAGITRNVKIMGKKYQNMQKAVTVLKILSKL